MSSKIAFYTQKYIDKMNGSTPEEMKAWIEGTNLSATEIKELEQSIKNHPEFNLTDDLNPRFIYTMTHTELLVQIVSGKIDPRELARKELGNRGLDESGNWVGFLQAKSN